MKRFLLLLLCFGVLQGAVGQPLPVAPAVSGAPELKQGRLVGVAIGSAVFYTATMILLRKAWYKKRVPFHAFNDNGEWLQMDKVGHAATAYLMSRGGYELFRWTGLNDRAATLTGGALALLFQTTLEVFDGTAEGWGFSRGDMVANVAGTALFMSQQYAFGNQPVQLKYGWRKSIYAPYRPNLLGKTTGIQLLKDYNAQQYWLSLNITSAFPVGPQFPRWLNLAVGYSGSGMTGGHTNPPYTGPDGREVVFERRRQFYLSPDADLSRIQQFSPTAQRFIGMAQFFKIAAPSLEYNRVNGVRFHPFLVKKD
ncbi:DUF2279 domain-containing protein [Rudanella lutea]|uniref:DUF2279 domain-containing protein n=1 Tax=Rudanella lutea TaxID=451374 RepID=UPI000379D168|nr:DUF2279 domain-containing protein [Rudanella lutea]